MYRSAYSIEERRKVRGGVGTKPWQTWLTRRLERQIPSSGKTTEENRPLRTKCLRIQRTSSESRIAIDSDFDGRPTESVSELSRKFSEAATSKNATFSTKNQYIYDTDLSRSTEEVSPPKSRETKVFQLGGRLRRSEDIYDLLERELADECDAEVRALFTPEQRSPSKVIQQNKPSSEDVDSCENECFRTKNNHTCHKGDLESSTQYEDVTYTQCEQMSSNESSVETLAGNAPREVGEDTKQNSDKTSAVNDAENLTTSAASTCSASPDKRNMHTTEPEKKTPPSGESGFSQDISDDKPATFKMNEPKPTALGPINIIVPHSGQHNETLMPREPSSLSHKSETLAFSSDDISAVSTKHKPPKQNEEENLKIHELIQTDHKSIHDIPVRPSVIPESIGPRLVALPAEDGRKKKYLIVDTTVDVVVTKFDEDPLVSNYNEVPVVCEPPPGVNTPVDIIVTKYDASPVPEENREILGQGFPEMDKGAHVAKFTFTRSPDVLSGANSPTPDTQNGEYSAPRTELIDFHESNEVDANLANKCSKTDEKGKFFPTTEAQNECGNSPTQNRTAELESLGAFPSDYVAVTTDSRWGSTAIETYRTPELRVSQNEVAPRPVQLFADEVASQTTHEAASTVSKIDLSNHASSPSFVKSLIKEYNRQNVAGDKEDLGGKPGYFQDFYDKGTISELSCSKAPYSKTSHTSTTTSSEQMPEESSNAEITSVGNHDPYKSTVDIRSRNPYCTLLPSEPHMTIESEERATATEAIEMTDSLETPKMRKKSLKPDDYIDPKISHRKSVSFSDEVKEIGVSSPTSPDEFESPNFPFRPPVFVPYDELRRYHRHAEAEAKAEACEHAKLALMRADPSESIENSTRQTAGIMNTMSHSDKSPGKRTKQRPSLTIDTSAAAEASNLMSAQERFDIFEPTSPLSKTKSFSSNNLELLCMVRSTTCDPESFDYDKKLLQELASVPRRNSSEASFSDVTYPKSQMYEEKLETLLEVGNIGSATASYLAGDSRPESSPHPPDQVTTQTEVQPDLKDSSTGWQAGRLVHPLRSHARPAKINLLDDKPQSPSRDEAGEEQECATSFSEVMRFWRQKDTED